jgi:hypothetical protein
MKLDYSVTWPFLMSKGHVLEEAGRCVFGLSIRVGQEFRLFHMITQFWLFLVSFDHLYLLPFFSFSFFFNYYY